MMSNSSLALGAFTVTEAPVSHGAHEAGFK